MAVFDLAQIIDSLQYGKLKTRNESLNTLSDYSIENLSLSPKQFASLLRGLIRSLQEERDTSNATPAAAKRITNTLTLIHDLIESNLIDTSTRPRYKIICDLGITLIEYYCSIRVPTECNVDALSLQVISFKTRISKILRLILSNWPVFTHLLQELWYQFYEFCIDAIKKEVHALKQTAELQYYNVTNEILIVDLFFVLLCLIGVDKPCSIITLVSKKSYQVLHNLMSDTFRCFKQKETPLHNMTLKIIHKLLEIISTEDIWFSHCLASLGIKVILQFAHSKTESLATLICVLLSNDNFHRYLTLDNFAVETIRKSHNASTLNVNIDYQVQLYSIGKILDAQIGLAQSLKSRLTDSDILVRANVNASTLSPRHIDIIQLATDNTLGWSLLEGLSKTLATYYKIRRSEESFQLSTDVSTSQEESYATDEPMSKRRKIDGRSKVSHCLNAFELMYTMLSSDDLGEQTCALQILFFSLKNCNSKSELKTKDGADKGKVDADALLRQAIALTSKIPFWPLLVCRSFLDWSNITREPFLKVDNQMFQSLLRVATSSIGDHRTYRLAAEILYILIQRYGVSNFQDGIPSCFQEIIDSPVICGPPYADYHACLVWVCLSNAYLNANMNTRKQFYTSIMTWVLDCFNRDSDLDGKERKPISWHLPILVGWLVGANTTLLEESAVITIEMETSYDNNHQNRLISFFCSEESHDQAKSAEAWLQFSTLSTPPESAKNLLDKICTTHNSRQNLFQSANMMVYSALVLERISFFCRERFKSQSARLSLFATDLMLSLARFVKNKADAIQVISTILLLSPSKETLDKLNFPFEIIDYRFRSLPLSIPATIVDASNSFLEEEFSQSDTKHTSISTRSPEEIKDESSDLYNSFILYYQDHSLEKSLTFLQTVSANVTLQCLSQCVDYLYRNRSIATQAECIKLVRLVGENCLSSTEFERDFKLLVLCCKILELICQIWDETQLIQKDYNDLYTYIQNLESKKLIISGEFYDHFATLNYVANYTSHDSTFIKSFSYTTDVNAMRARLASKISALGVTEAKSLARFEAISMLVDSKFGLNSVEHDATGCFIILDFITEFPSLAPLAVKSFTLLSRIVHMVPCIKFCISTIVELIGEDNSSTLLESNSISILKAWYLFNGSFNEFPHQIFGYNNEQDFQRNNYRSIMCVCCAVDVKKGPAFVNSEIEKLCNSIEIKNLKVWKACIPSMVPLAYTSNGRRNDIFQTIGHWVKEPYKSVMEELLNLLILETILLTDFSDEGNIIKIISPSSNGFLFNSKSEEINKPEVFISPKSSKGLILALIELYETKLPTKYWTPSSIRFFVRRLITTNFGNSFEKLRAVKFFLCISEFDFEDSAILEMLYMFSSNYVTLEFSSVLSGLVEKMNLNFLGHLPSKNAHSCILKVLSNYLRYNAYSSWSLTLLEDLEAFLSKRFDAQGLSHGAKNFYIEIVKFVKDSSRSVNLSCIEKYFEDPLMSDTVKKNKIRICAILFRIFPNASFSGPLLGCKNLINIFLDSSIKSGSTLFRAKVADYLGNLYVRGDLLEDMNQIADRREFIDSEDNLSENNLNFVLKFLGDQLLSENPDSVAFAECVIGVLNHYGPIEKSYTKEYFDLLVLEELRDAYSVNIEEFTLLYPGRHPKSTSPAQTMKNQVVNSSNFQWIQSMLVIIFESWNTNLKSLLALKRLIHDLPEATSLIPSLWCFHVKIAGKKGMDSLLEFFEDFFRSPLLKGCSESVQLIKDLVLAIRNYAIAGQKIFQKLYKILDLQKLFLILKDTTFSKTALLLLDDHVHSFTVPDCLSIHEKSLTDLYIGLDEVDFLSGLPEKSNLKSSLELLNVSAPSHELLQYECAKFDSLSTFSQKTNIRSISKSFLQDGIIGIPMLFDESLLQGTSYEWAWKLSKWELPYKEEKMNKDEALYNYFYHSRNSLMQSDSQYETIMSDLVKNRTCIENLSFKDRLSLTKEYFETLRSMASVHKIMKVKPDEFESLGKDFENSSSLHPYLTTTGLEILQARIVALRNHSVFRSNNEEGKVLATLAQVSEMVKYNDLARRRDLKQKVLNSTLLLDEFVSKSEYLTADLRIEIGRRSTFQAAKAMWAEGRSDLAVAMCEGLSNAGSIEIPYKGLSVHQMLINAYKVKWISLAHLDSGLNLLEKHIAPMYQAASEIEQIEQRDKVYRLLAEFCDEQSNSKQFNLKIKELRERLQSRKQEVEDIKSHYGKTSVTSAEKKRVQKYYSRLKLQISSQTSELDELMGLKRKFQCFSVKLYLKSILLFHNEKIADKLFSLMMEKASDVELQREIENDMSMISASTCVNWVTQLLSRISTEASIFQSSIKSLIQKICVKHPFHSLYYLISLEYHEDLADENENLAMFMRVNAAKEIKRKLNTQSKEYVDTYLHPIDRFCQESVQLSQYKISKSRFIQLDKLKLGYFWLNDLPLIPPPTLEIKVSDSGYENVPKMVSIDQKVVIATSGLSLPKIATFGLSNGRSHKMLLKHSSDDIRQDAIMEQVFVKVKNFMSENSEACKRNLTIRTYRAVPLGPKAGVIEFVANTTALIEILRPYHQKKDQIKIETARDMMKSVQNETLAKRVKIYQEITSNIKPVFRNYFIDTFRTPDSWYESRLAYSRGIATTSMVGHILGLGDRHCNNILIDGATGEPVHIDLGVAFDQGKRLPIPETVPFRLTRDIVDGFGITKTRGVFSKACEHTLQILRENEHRILSILDALRWDPLYSWSISPIRMNKLQETGEGELDWRPHEDGSDAATAILAVSEKLNAGGLSVSAAVRDLVTEATDENNLAVIYCGWCPFY